MATTIFGTCDALVVVVVAVVRLAGVELVRLCLLRSFEVLRFLLIA